MRPRDLKVAGVVGIGAEAGSSWGSGDGLDVDASSGDGILGGELTVEGEVASSEDGKYRRDARTHGRLPTFSNARASPARPHGPHAGSVAKYFSY